MRRVSGGWLRACRSQQSGRSLRYLELGTRSCREVAAAAGRRDTPLHAAVRRPARPQKRSRSASGRQPPTKKRVGATKKGFIYMAIFFLLNFFELFHDERSGNVGRGGRHSARGGQRSGWPLSVRRRGERARGGARGLEGASGHRRSGGPRPPRPARSLVDAGDGCAPGRPSARRVGPAAAPPQAHAAAVAGVLPGNFFGASRKKDADAEA